MIDEPPAQSSDPPPAASSEVSPMSFAAATAWSSGIVLAFWMLMVAVAPREGARAAGDLVGSMACQAIAYLLGLFLILRVHAPDASIRDFLGIRGTNAGFYPLAVLIGVSLELPLQSFYVLISRRWPSPEESEGRLAEMFTQANPSMRVVLGFLIVLLGPFVEEVFFRGALFRPLLKRYSVGLVVSFTAIFFALSHGMPQSVVPIAIVGVFMGILRAWSGSLIPSLLLHATFNAFPFVAQAMAASASQVDDESLPPLWMNATSVVVAIALVASASALASRSKAAAAARERDLR